MGIDGENADLFREAPCRAVEIRAAADVPMTVLGQFQKFLITAAVLGVIDFDAVKVMGQDLVQRPLEQSRMGQDCNAPGQADKGDTVVDAAAVIRHVGWTPAIEELIKDRLDVREIAFGHELAGNMGPADGAALSQRRFDGAAVDIITKRPASVDDFQGPVEAPFLELGAVSLQPVTFPLAQK